MSLQQTSYIKSLTVTLLKLVTAAIKIYRIIKGHEKKVTQIKRHHKLECNCRIETECPVNGDYRIEDVIYKCTVLTTFQPQKMYLGFAEGEFKKQRNYSQAQSFRNENYSNSITLSSYGWKIKKIKKETPTLVWEIVRTDVPYTSTTKQCLHEKLAILMYSNQSELLKKRSELVSKCRHEKKFLLQTFNSND